MRSKQNYSQRYPTHFVRGAKNPQSKPAHPKLGQDFSRSIGFSSTNGSLLRKNQPAKYLTGKKQKANARTPLSGSFNH
jgi:hypothetical protein